MTYLGPVLRRLSISKQTLVIRISDHRFALTTAPHLRPKPHISDPEFVDEFVFHVSDHSPASLGPWDYTCFSNHEVVLLTSYHELVLRITIIEFLG